MVGSFVPSGYEMEQALYGDFAGAGHRDAALLIVPECDTAEGASAGREQQECKAEGRVLVILFQTVARGYRLSAAARVASTISNHGDTFGGMTARGRTLVFSGAWSSCAGQSGNSDSVQYRFQNGEWLLIGRDTSSWNRGACGGDLADPGVCNDLPANRLRPGEVCVEVDRSTNYSTARTEALYSVVPATERDVGEARTVVIRRPANPLPRDKRRLGPMEF
jgi:hypothetical protein